MIPESTESFGQQVARLCLILCLLNSAAVFSAGLNHCVEDGSTINADVLSCLLHGDFDGDGIPLREDLCLKTPPGVPVDAQGCEFDSDGDAVPDRLDLCPATLVGTVVTENGCRLSVDGDGDGVAFEKDDCPYSPDGAQVDACGCAVSGDDFRAIRASSRCASRAATQVGGQDDLAREKHHSGQQARFSALRAFLPVDLRITHQLQSRIAKQPLEKRSPAQKPARVRKSRRIGPTPVVKTLPPVTVPPAMPELQSLPADRDDSLAVKDATHQAMNASIAEDEALLLISTQPILREKRQTQASEKASLAKSSSPPAKAGSAFNTCADGCIDTLRKPIGKIHFVAKRSGLTAYSKGALLKLLVTIEEQLMKRPTMVLELAGYAEAGEVEQGDYVLSVDRTVAVRNYLQQAGIDPDRIFPVGYGAAYARQPANSPAAIADRRVDLRLIPRPVFIDEAVSLLEEAAAP